MPKQKIAREIAKTVTTLKKRFPAPAWSEKETPWRCLLFTVLSARSRDEQTEKVFQRLIKKYPTPHTLAKAKPKDVMPIISGIGLYRNKARNVVALAKAIVTQHGGRVPRNYEELVKLPGVGTKTANCVLVYAYRIPAIPVDTHVHRIANKLGWVRTRTPEKTEQALMKIVPKKYWMDLNRVLVHWGRTREI